jgi:osmotically-inducible protein OsmY
LYTDAEIVQLVDRELTADPRIGIDGIKTRVMHGDVVLSGWVDSLFAKRLAGRITGQVLGVTNVRNELEVRASTHSDQSVRLELLEILKSDPLLANTEIAVAVLDGAVTLRGRVSAHPQRFRATSLTSRVSGVRQIENELQVSLAQVRGDDSIRDDIVKRLDSNAITGEIAEQVGVSVEGGVVTLSGKVERYVVVLEALRIASRTDGVRKVENRLKVTRQ